MLIQCLYIYIVIMSKVILVLRFKWKNYSLFKYYYMRNNRSYSFIEVIVSEYDILINVIFQLLLF